MTKLLDADIYKPVKEWQSLSDEEILECLSKTKWNDIDYCLDHDDFFIHIEQVLREKNNG